MTNHPNRSAAGFRFIAFSMVTQDTRAHASTAREALALAVRGLDNADFIEVLDCGENGLKVWDGGAVPSNPVPLFKARALHPTVFRGAGYADSYKPLPAVALAAR